MLPSSLERVVAMHRLLRSVFVTALLCPALATVLPSVGHAANCKRAAIEKLRAASIPPASGSHSTTIK
jgi:hypothetical protein